MPCFNCVVLYEDLFKRVCFLLFLHRVLATVKGQLGGAKKGYDLLKKKSDAIKIRLQSILKEILDVKRKMGVEIRESYFSHTQAQWAVGDFNHQVIADTRGANLKVAQRINNVAGVKLPVFEATTFGTDDTLVGLARGGKDVIKCKELFTKTVTDLIQLASLQTSLRTLDEALKVTNRSAEARRARV